MSSVFEHPWLGGLFAHEDMAQIWSADRQMSHMLAFESAFSLALAKSGLADADAARNAAQQIEKFLPNTAALRGGAGQDGLVVPSLVRQLRAHIGGDPKTVHHGATSQDVIDTALAMTLRECSVLLHQQLGQLFAALKQLEAEQGAHRLMGRTRMQAALWVTAKDRINTWSAPLQQHIARLDRIRPEVECVQLGGAVGDGQVLAEHWTQVQRDVADTLGLNIPTHVWHSTRDGIADYAGLLSLITGSLGKMGTDIALMAQQGAEDIQLTGGGTSSAMPHKQNPVLAELLITLARFNATQVAGLHHALLHEQERSGSAWALEWMILPQMAQATARALSAAKALCGQITLIGVTRPRDN